MTKKIKISVIGEDGHLPKTFAAVDGQTLREGLENIRDAFVTGTRRALENIVINTDRPFIPE